MAAACRKSFFREHPGLPGHFIYARRCKSRCGDDGVKKKGKVLFRNVVLLILSIMMLILGAGCLYVDNLLNKINYAQAAVKTGALFVAGANSAPTDAKSGILGGLYHDDAITNILILGTDDYQINDVGRSDSMLMVSVDTRHKKLKLISFMRDLYVAIPGHKSNKLNAAYSDAGGGPAGAELVVSTIEANFGIDIDRYVLIRDSAFPKIIDRLGGVTVTLTKGEAQLVNEYCGNPLSHLTAGTSNLNGAQAHYYTRIRAIGSDFARTQRQRTVFTSLVNKFKNSSTATIYGALADTLNLVATDMTKDEILSMASNSLTYLKYPVSQDRIPADNEYRSETIAGAGDSLVPDLEACRKSVATFIYENDIPQKSYQNVG